MAMVTDALEGNAPLQRVQAVGGWSTPRMITDICDRNLYAEPVARYRKARLPRRRENHKMEHPVTHPNPMGATYDPAIP